MDEKDVKVGFGRRIVVKHENDYLGGTVVEIDAGKQTDLAFNRLTDKIVYVLNGKLMVSVLKDGVMKKLVVDTGASFFVRAGLVHQFAATEARTIFIEFVNNIVDYESDVYVIAKGSLPESQKQQVVATEVVQEKQQAVEEVVSIPEVEEKVVKTSKTGRRKSKKAN